MQRLLGYVIANRNPLRDINTWRRRMSTWVTKQFDSDMEKIDMSIPIIEKPDQLLLQVKAASVNLIDTLMRKGYGRKLCSAVKIFEIVQTIQHHYYHLLVDEIVAVIAVVDPFSSGTHAEFVIANESNCVLKPTNISYVDGTAFPYVACTAWSALVSIARINPHNAASQRVLIHGGAGGVGTTAIQMLKAWNVEKIVVTCSDDRWKSFNAAHLSIMAFLHDEVFWIIQQLSINMVQKLGAIPINYKSPEAMENLINEGPFDVVLDCAESELAECSNRIMGLWRNSVHVSLLSPLLSDTDRYGIPFGIASTAIKYFLKAALVPNHSTWTMVFICVFAPHPKCMQQISEFLKDGKMKPIIDQIFKYDELPIAYEKVLRKREEAKQLLDLNEYNRTNANEKPFKSETCGNGFIWLSGLTIHSWIHTGEKPSKCHVCDKRFT
ncbi:Reticulon-4-interacting protein 1, mitochondrial [Dirofilaria immitis]|nr:Reticulon-4-interacting protein 1, mitochondrial [Dirofilaria immitis]